MHKNKGKGIKDITKKINKKIIKPISKTGDKALKAGTQLGLMTGKLTNDELLPAVKTIGIPIASTAVGMLGDYVGGPVLGGVSEKLSSNLMEK